MQQSGLRKSVRETIDSLATNPLDLGAAAQSLRAGMESGKTASGQPLCGTHYYRLQSFPNTFVGSEVVSWLVDEQLAFSRQIAKEFMQRILEAGGIEHVTLKHDFEDAEFFYRWRDSSELLETKTVKLFDMDARNVEEVFQAAQKIKKLSETAVNAEGAPLIGVHRYRLEKFPNTFLGSEMVSWLSEKAPELFSNADGGARQIVFFLDRLVNLGAISHVTEARAFKDEELCYLWNDVDHLLARQAFINTTRAQDSKKNVPERFSADKFDATAEEPLMLLRAALRVQAEMQKGANADGKPLVGVHTYHLHPYPDTFIGSEAVTWAVSVNLGASRQDATNFLDKLLGVNALSHVTKEHTFKDEELFYRWNDVGAKCTSWLLGVEQKNKVPEEPLELFDLVRRWVDLGPGALPTGELLRASLRLRCRMEASKTAQGMSLVDTHVYRLKPYPNTFVGSEAVTWALKCGIAFTREVATVLLDRLLLAGTFQHVKKKHGFKDAEFFYTWKDISIALTQAEILEKKERKAAAKKQQEDRQQKGKARQPAVVIHAAREPVGKGALKKLIGAFTK